MPTISVFQKLPLHIAEAIAVYCIAIQPGNDVLLDSYVRKRQIWSMLYNVSYSWRALALTGFLRWVTLRISIESGTGQFEVDYLPDGVELDNTNYHYVKGINILFSRPQSILDKDAMLKDFSKAWPEDIVFPSVRSLSINMHGFIYQQIDDHSATCSDKFYWISQRIRTSLPKLQKVAIDDSEVVSNTQDRACNVDGFLSAIFSKVSELSCSIHMANSFSNYSFMQNGTGLTCLEFSYDGGADTFSPVIAKSALTLESLKYFCRTLQSVRSIVLDDAGVPIVYPRLQKLGFYNVGRPKIGTKLRMDGSVAPFPALRHLTWLSLYIFDDEALFRGNSSTLEYLHIQVDVELVDILHRYKVFSDGKYSRLSHVTAGNSVDREGSSLVYNVRVEFIMNFISPAAQYLAVSNISLYDQSIDAISASPHFGNIRILSISSLRLEISKLINLVKCLPNMTRLSCPPGETHMEPGSAQFRSFIDGIYCRSHCLSKNLKQWNALIMRDDDLNCVVQTALTFAILCTDFAFVFSSWRYSKDIGRHIKNATASGFYSDYANKLQHMLRIKY